MATSPSGSPVAPGALTLRISEIFSDPVETGRDAAWEWVELVNHGTEAVGTNVWMLGDGTRSQPLPSVIVPPGGYLVVAGESAQFGASAVVVRSPTGEIGNGLGNEGDLVRLAAPGGEIVDEVSYGNNESVFDPAPEAPAQGKSLGLIDITSDPASENWAGTLRPTPGEPNVFPPTAVSTVAGAATSAAEDDAEDEASRTPLLTDPPDGRGSSVAPWIVLGGLAGLSLGVAGAAYGRKARLLGARIRAR